MELPDFYSKMGPGTSCHAFPEIIFQHQHAATPDTASHMASLARNSHHLPFFCRVPAGISRIICVTSFTVSLGRTNKNRRLFVGVTTPISTCRQRPQMCEQMCERKYDEACLLCFQRLQQIKGLTSVRGRAKLDSTEWMQARLSQSYLQC